MTDINPETRQKLISALFFEVTGSVLLSEKAAPLTLEGYPAAFAACGITVAGKITRHTEGTVSVLNIEKDGHENWGTQTGRKWTKTTWSLAKGEGLDDVIASGGQGLFNLENGHDEAELVALLKDVAPQLGIDLSKVVAAEETNGKVYATSPVFTALQL